MFQGAESGSEGVFCDKEIQQGGIGIGIGGIDVVQEAWIIERLWDIFDLFADVDTTTFAHHVEIFSSQQDFILDALQLRGNLVLSPLATCSGF